MKDFFVNDDEIKPLREKKTKGSEKLCDLYFESNTGI